MQGIKMQSANACHLNQKAFGRPACFATRGLAAPYEQYLSYARYYMDMLHVNIRSSPQDSASFQDASACRSRRACLIVRAEQQQSRRESLAGLFAASLAAAQLSTRSAHAAILGIEGDKERDEEYKSYTTEVIKDVQSALALPKDDPGRPDAIGKVRDETSKWVAKYRRDGTFQGRASYGNTYSALSALAGHYNSFGPETNVPKKRLDRLTKELADAEKLIARGR